MNAKFSLLISLLVLSVPSTPAAAGESARHSGASAQHSAAAFGESVEASAGLVSAAVAVPLVAIGAIGTASGQAGEALWYEGTGEPLPIAEETVTGGPNPAEALGLEGDFR